METFTTEGLTQVWKTEPESPSPSWEIELLGDVELWGVQDTSWNKDAWKCEEWDISHGLLRSPEGSLSSGEEILDDIDGIIKSEDWTEGLYGGYENMDVWDCYKNYTPMVEPNIPQEQPMVIPSQTDLLREFEDVLTQTTESLTPPDSPQSQEQMFINILEEISPGDMTTTTQIIENTETPNVPACSPSSVEPWSSPSPSQSDSGYDDPDWSPSDWSPGQTVPEPKRSHRKTTTTEERRLRKKEQNKNAATRYRQKKKQEMEGIIGEEKGLQDENDHLKTEVTEITREIRYLKSLMRDLFKAKGLLK